MIDRYTREQEGGKHCWHGLALEPPRQYSSYFYIFALPGLDAPLPEQGLRAAGEGPADGPRHGQPDWPQAGRQNTCH